MKLFFGDTTADKPYRDGSGRPLAGAVLTVWKHGTTSPATVIGEDGFPMSGPFVTDENGVLPNLYLDPWKKYRVRMVDARGVLIFDVDPYVSESALFRSPIYHARDEDDMPIAGATLAFFRLNTAIPKDTYADGDGLAEHPNPIRADAGGFFPPIYLEAAESPSQVYEVVPSFGGPIYDPPIGDRFVVVGNAGDNERIAWSDDGDEWHSPESAPDGEWNDVTYSSRLGVFVAVGNDNQVIRSTDGGKNWELCDVQEAQVDWISVHWTGEEFWAGQGHPSSQVAADSWLSSTDGEQWTLSGSDLGVSFRTEQLASHDGILLAAGRYTTQSEGIAKLSSPGRGLYDIPPGNPATGVVYSELLSAFVSGNGANVSSSTDGESWTTLSSSAIRKLWEFGEWGQLFTLIPGSGLIGSEDGVTWTTIFTEPSEVNLTGMASSSINRVLVLVSTLQTGTPIPQIYRTTDLSTLIPVASPPPRASWQSVVAGFRLIPGAALPQPPTPQITSLDPSSIHEGSGDFTLTVHGTDFLPPDHDDASVVRWNGSERATTYISDTELEAAILAADVEDDGTAQVTVANADRVSDPAVFTISSSSGLDPHFANVLALVGVEGTVTEAIGVASLSLVGTTAVSSAQAKFGNDSLSCPANGQNTAGIRMSAADDYFVFPGQFTLEGWFYPSTLPRFYSIFDGQRNHPASGSWTLQGTQNGGLVFVLNGNFSTGPNTGDGAVVVGTWQHIALTRDASNVVRIFVNGVLKASATHAGVMGAADEGLSNFNISRGIASDNSSFNGFCEEIRVTKGVCRYTENFTPPDEPFPRS